MLTITERNVLHSGQMPHWRFHRKKPAGCILQVDIDRVLARIPSLYITGSLLWTNKNLY